MAIAVYLSNNIIRAVIGSRSKERISVRQKLYREIPEGLLINGIITDEAALAEQLAAMWQEHKLPLKDVWLTVHSSKFVTKQLKLPRLGKKQLEAMIPMEFSDVERYEDAVFDYMDMPGAVPDKKFREYFGLMAERSFVEDYVRLFEQIGVRLSGFTNALAAALRLFAAQKALQRQTCLIQVVDGQNLESIVWIDGKFNQATNRRIFAQRGTRDYDLEVIRHTSTTMQFVQSLKLDQQLTRMMVCGMTAAEVSDLRELAAEAGLSQLTALEAGMPEAQQTKGTQKTGTQKTAQRDVPAADFVYPAGALYQGGKEINLLNVYRKDPESVAGTARRRRAMIPAAVTLAAGILISGVLGGGYLVKRGQLKELQSYLDDPGNQKTAAAVDTLDESIAGSNTILKDIAQVQRMMESYPLVNNVVRSTVLSCSNAAVSGEITGYKAEDGILQIDARASQVTEIHAYISRLEATGLFSSLDYSGYTYNAGDNAYTVNVLGYLTESAGR